VSGGRGRVVVGLPVLARCRSAGPSRQRRRILLAAGATILLGRTHAAEAQLADARPVVGVLLNGAAAGSSGLNLDALRAGLRDLGYVEGRHFSFAVRFAEGDLTRLPALAAALVALGPAVIVSAGPQAGRALKRASTTVPIVLAIVGDPVEAGLVATLAHPGGNVTGLVLQNAELTSKRLQLLRELVPDAQRIAVLADESMRAGVSEALNVAASLGFSPRLRSASRAADLGAAFQAMRRDGAQALIVLASPMFEAQRLAVVKMAAEAGLPATYEARSFVDAGGLMSYGPNFEQMYREAARYVDKLLKGVRAGDLPMEQPTRVELVINRRTAKALGLSVPRSLLLRADQLLPE